MRTGAQPVLLKDQEVLGTLVVGAAFVGASRSALVLAPEWALVDNAAVVDNAAAAAVVAGAGVVVVAEAGVVADAAAAIVVAVTGVVAVVDAVVVVRMIAAAVGQALEEPGRRADVIAAGTDVRAVIEVVHEKVGWSEMLHVVG